MTNDQRRIAVDLDGVIFKYDYWKGIDHYGKPVEFVREALTILQKMGFEIIIYSTRTNPYVNPEYNQEELIDKIVSALQANNIPFDGISTDKPLAEYYIDDRGIRFENWLSTIEEIKILEKK